MINYSKKIDIATKLNKNKQYLQKIPLNTINMTENILEQNLG